ncbi:MAG: 3,4-dihydroxy-2-butanone-4-phosphate synthase [Phycisphaeraceae bacterium]|nr:MAG: 3,4-dihydroxy-2-butanone-4-phosphate synthase [Phycisphaeraceae bacterium]
MLSPIPEILDELRAGRMIVLVDDEGRENEGDLVIPAQMITPEAINFMLRVARGYMCLSLTGADCDRLDLHAQTNVNTSVRATPMTVSIDGHPRHGFTTGVSAHERARTILMAIDGRSSPDDFVRPGHINPLRARDGGVLVRTGQTEGSVDLCRLAGLHPSAVIIEIMRDDGEMARMPDLEKLCAEHGLKICSVAQVIEHRLRGERLIRRLPPAQGEPIRTEFGEFNLIAFESVVDPLPHIALTVGGVGSLDPSGVVNASPAPTLVRMHRRNVLGDIFGDLSSSPEGPTGETLRRSMRMIQEEGRGALVYLRPEGYGDALSQRLQAIRRSTMTDPNHPDLTAPVGPGADAMPMPLREFGIGGQILRELGLSKLRLLSDHPRDLPGLDAFGLEIVEHVAVRRE